MALVNQRIIHGDNATLVDKSKELNDFVSGEATFPIVAADDYIYIGSDLPFNHRYFLAGSTVNANVSAISIDIWDGNEWEPAVDVVDYTSVGGATLAQSGYIRWTVDRNGFFGQEDTTEDITDLATLKIYDFYWVRLSFSADLTAGTALKYVGFKFAEDDDLALLYPDLNLSATKSAFTSGKTNWNDQHFLAAEEIIRRLRKKHIVWSRNQILDWEQFYEAGIHKAAELIMTPFGDDFEDNRQRAVKKFETAMNLGTFITDRDEDGQIDERERRFYAGLQRT